MRTMHLGFMAVSLMLGFAAVHETLSRMESAASVLTEALAARR